MTQYSFSYRGDAVKRTHNLNVLGIQLTRFQDKQNKIFTPDSNENLWLYAKMIVQNADGRVSINLMHFRSVIVS